MLSSESVSGLSIKLIDKDEYNKEVAEKMSRVTVITGGTSGIGRGIVEKILANSEQDDLIFATYAHNAYKANEFWDSLKPEDQEKLIIMKADMSSYNDMMNFVKEVKEKACIYDQRIYAGYDRGRKRSLHGILCGAAGILFIPCIRCDQGGNPFPYQILGKGI